MQERELEVADQVGGGRGLWRSLDPEWLRRKVVEERVRRVKIAELAGVSIGVVAYALKQHGIKAPVGFRDKYDVDPAWLRCKYVNEGLSLVEVAELAGCDYQTIAKRLRRQGVAVRPSWDSGERDGRRPWRDRDWVIEMYYGQGLTQQQMADMCGCHLQTIAKAMRGHGIVGRRPGDRAGRGEAEQSGAEVCWACPYRENCLDWPVDAPCRLVGEKQD